MKQLVFDTTDASTIADSDSVGAFVRSDDGTLITHHTLAGGEHLDVYAAMAAGDGTALTATGTSLDVNVTNGITAECDLDGVYNVSTNADPDNVGVIAHTRAASIGDAQQVERTTAAAPGSVASADKANMNGLDVNAVMLAENGTSGDLEIPTINDTSGGLEVHIANSISVDDAALANTAIATAANQLDVANTAEDAVAAPLANRKYLFIHNFGNRKIFVGQSGVTSANGYPLAPKDEIVMRAGASIDIEWVGPNTNQSIRTLELS